MQTRSWMPICGGAAPGRRASWKAEVVAVAGETPLMIVGGKGVVAQWSHQAEELLGRPAGEVVGRPATDLVSPVPAPGSDAAERCRHDALRDVAARAARRGLRLQPALREDGSVTWEIFLPPASEMAPGMETAVLKALSAHTAGALFVGRCAERCSGC
ncbi:hypothetical protein ACFWIJ_34540 [Streptomyces sp. NPDC127079]|uniref:hypothetical protein n=1 Tax=Streptomyces sp. NPDC127079 TaxID=3347132 RepID=UPI00364EF1F3